MGKKCPAKEPNDSSWEENTISDIKGELFSKIF